MGGSREYSGHAAIGGIVGRVEVRGLGFIGAWILRLEAALEREAWASAQTTTAYNLAFCFSSVIGCFE
jgi:hypothetical protein